MSLADCGSTRCRPADIAAVVADMHAQENRIVAAMAISDGSTDFRSVFTRGTRRAARRRRDDAPRALLRGRIAYDLKQLPAAEVALRRALELAGPTDLAGVLADASIVLALVVGWEQDRHEAGTAYADTAGVHAAAHRRSATRGGSERGARLDR